MEKELELMTMNLCQIGISVSNFRQPLIFGSVFGSGIDPISLLYLFLVLVGVTVSHDTLQKKPKILSFQVNSG